ncbi:MAG: hypothetical protein HN353_10940 [Bdellovibrionales bacterium]|jgi:HKD family nuclease|nr:hypothetical protein [Bdellovibrionales bacterium]MBT3524811.1 hypothetical protein [Bdellovibrionales bacterium]MBT7670084.1 hypothetical protein [Bdellovibrionales bacterium]MBT7768178.1 hypothetical protein [Bdellovibrionales bacterium]
MKLLCLIVTAIIYLHLTITNSYAVNLKDYTPYNYQVLFTNPDCSDYYYPTPMENNRGELVQQKPKGAYCKKQDGANSALRPSSPEYRLIEWIRDVKTKEIFFSYLSFSNARVADALCQAVVERNVKINFILDRRTGKRMANLLINCRPHPRFLTPNLPRVHYRGHEGEIGYAHNKYFIVNPNHQQEIKITFSSGNLSSGTVLHHENWHFITTHASSYFAQIHLCMMEGTLNHYQDSQSYQDFIQRCRQRITTPEEEDIKVFLIPGEGEQAMNTIARSIKQSDRIYLAAHRFSNRKLIDLLAERLKDHESTPVDMRLVVDDDIYWTYALRVPKFGANRSNEQRKVQYLTKYGLQVRYIQTNHSSFLLHHNKFIIFQGERESSIFTGAGNLTTAAFTKNFENFYQIKIPEVVKSFTGQYQHLFNNLGSSKEEMPVENFLP